MVGAAYLKVEIPFDGAVFSSVDEKGRVVVPKKIRDAIGDRCVLFLNEYKSVSIYSTATWLQMNKRMFEQDSSNPAWGDLSRFLFANSVSDAAIDRQGRLLIPQRMRDAAQLGEEIMVLGCLNRCELWNKAEYDKFEEDPDGYQSARKDRYSRIWNQVNGQQ